MGIKMATRRLLNGVLISSLLASVFLSFGAPVKPSLADGEILISEIRIDQTSTDNDEYFELVGAPGSSLDGLTYLVIGDGTGGSGVIEQVTDLTGQVIPASGYFVAAESTFTLGTADLVTDLNFENSDNVTHLLVSGFTGTNGDDLDTDDDGVLDATPWTAVLDLIALIEEENPPSGTEYHYGPPTIGPDGTFVPGHAFLCPEGWAIGTFDVGIDDTPGAENTFCAGPDYTPIYDIQFTTDPSGDSPLIGQEVTTEGIVTAIFGSGYFIQDPAFSDWAGLWVFDGTNTPALGDRLRLTGLIEEYFDLTEINAPTGYEVVSSGNVLPDPVVLDTGSVSQEQWEGMLVQVENVTVINADLGYGEWSVDDSTGEVVIDDKGDYTYVPVAGDPIDTIVGPLDYSFGAFKIQPRDDADIVLPAPPSTLVINEFLADPPNGLDGDANGDGTRDSSQDEFVEIVNNGDAALDVSGWTLSDGFGERHVFPADTVIPAHCAIVVFGGGTPTGAFGGVIVQTASSGALGLNNSGDTITLAGGGTEVVVTYGGEGGNNQSLTRDPDITGDFVEHSTATGSGGALFSPGTLVDGTPFAGCGGPTLTPIYDIQFTTDPSGDSPLVGQEVTTEGIVYATYAGRGFCIADDTGPWHGIYVYYPSGTLPQVGDEVQVVGEVVEYYGLTELSNFATYTVLSSGNTPHGPNVVTAADIAFDDPASEGYEGVFVELHDIEVTAGANTYGIWDFTDASAATGKVDDWGYDLEPNVGDTFDILRGALIYDFSEYKVNPRDAGDVFNFPEIVVTEIMQNPDAVYDSVGEWFEVYNAGSTAVDMNGWTFYDLGSDAFTVASPLLIQPGEYLVFGINGDINVNGGLVVDYVYTGFNLSNGDDEIIVTMPDATEIDRVEYDGGTEWPDPTGASMMLLDVALDNNVGANWQATEGLTYGLGDFGTPGCPNDGCPWTDLTIPEIQGADYTSPYSDTLVRTTGVVVGFFEGNLPSGGNFDGFFIQDPAGDGDPTTSDGILVNHGLLDVSVNMGDLVSVVGTVREFNEYGDPPPDTETQIEVSSALDVTVLGSDTVPPTVIDPDGSEPYLESLEGMLVTLPVTGSVVGPTNYGTIMVVPGDEGVDRVMRGSPQQHMVFGVRPDERYGSGAPNLIVGSVVDGVNGPLAFTYGNYVVADQDGYTVPYDQPTPAEPPSWADALENELTVATFNVENFFDTLDDPDKSDPVESLADYETHRDKIAATVVAANCPLVVGVEEAEKLDVLEDLAAQIAPQGCDYSALLLEGLDGRGIDVGYLVRNDRVSVVDVWQHQDCTTYDTGLGQGDCAEGEQLLYSRLPLVLTADVQIGPTPENSVQITFIVNHLKSKFSRTGDPESAQWRLLQAQSLATLVDGMLTADPAARLVVMGDLNDFEDSAPLQALYDAGLENLWFTLPTEARYSYIYGGVSQVLDHVLVSPQMSSRLVDVGALHTNADYPYLPFYDDPTVVWHTSDHDPVAATFDFYPPVAAFTPGATEVLVDEAVTFVNESTGDEPLSFLWDFGDGTTSTEASPSHSWAEPGTYLVTLTASNDLGSASASVEILVKPRTVPLAALTIGKASIYWRGNVGRFHMIGELELPEGYSRDDLTGELKLAFAIGGESAADTVLTTERGRVWRFRELPTYPIEGVEIVNVLVIWPMEGSSRLPKFLLQGKLSLPGVDKDTDPPQAEIALTLPLIEGHEMERLEGETVLSFQVKGRRWYYLSR